MKTVCARVNSCFGYLGSKITEFKDSHYVIGLYVHLYAISRDRHIMSIPTKKHLRLQNRKCVLFGIYVYLLVRYPLCVGVATSLFYWFFRGYEWVHLGHIKWPSVGAKPASTGRHARHLPLVVSARHFPPHPFMDVANASDTVRKFFRSFSMLSVSSGDSSPSIPTSVSPKCLKKRMILSVRSVIPDPIG